ncbi:hypothetical protein AB837_00465 [bacterium AB1]|nr:hypothetical protein AB837_00465 [bacterium AB1]
MLISTFELNYVLLTINIKKKKNKIIIMKLFKQKKDNSWSCLQKSNHKQLDQALTRLRKVLSHHSNDQNSFEKLKSNLSQTLFYQSKKNGLEKRIKKKMSLLSKDSLNGIPTYTERCFEHQQKVLLYQNNAILDILDIIDQSSASKEYVDKSKSNEFAVQKIGLLNNVIMFASANLRSLENNILQEVDKVVKTQTQKTISTKHKKK